MTDVTSVPGQFTTIPSGYTLTPNGFTGTGLSFPVGQTVLSPIFTDNNNDTGGNYVNMVTVSTPGIKTKSGSVNVQVPVYPYQTVTLTSAESAYASPVSILFTGSITNYGLVDATSVILTFTSNAPGSITSLTYPGSPTPSPHSATNTISQNIANIPTGTTINYTVTHQIGFNAPGNYVATFKTDANNGPEFFAPAFNFQLT